MIIRTLIFTLLTVKLKQGGTCTYSTPASGGVNTNKGWVVGGSAREGCRGQHQKVKEKYKMIKLEFGNFVNPYIKVTECLSVYL